MVFLLTFMSLHYWMCFVLMCLTAIISGLNFLLRPAKKGRPQAKLPGPTNWPIIGSIPYMARFSNNVEALKSLAEEYGQIVSLRLGSVDFVVVSGMELIRTVLVTRAQHFDSRPGFKRFDMLFDGDRNNSLAFADWSETQKKRREVVSIHSLIKRSHPRFEDFQSIAECHIQKMVDNLKYNVSCSKSTELHFLKTYITETTLKIFLKYFCDLDITYENHAEFLTLVKTFDDIFQEINTPCIGDIFPALMPFCQKSHLEHFGDPIRSFLLKYCVEPRKAEGKFESCKLLDALLASIGENKITEESALFALEDMIGGHSAVSNMLTTAFLLIAQNPEVQDKIRKEVATTFGDNPISLKENLPYIEAVVWEAVRHISSPLVPHVANQDTNLGGFHVKQGTVLLLNNGELNFSPKYWDNPGKFDPQRFLKDGQIFKPDFYIPFGTGRRSCLGFRLLLNTSVLAIANICKEVYIGLDPSECNEWTLGNLAVKDKGFGFKIISSGGGGDIVK